MPCGIGCRQRLFNPGEREPVFDSDIERDRDEILDVEEQVLPHHFHRFDHALLVVPHRHMHSAVLIAGDLETLDLHPAGDAVVHLVARLDNGRERATSRSVR